MGGRTPIKIGETTVTSGQTVVSAISALKASAGSKLTNAIADTWGTLKIKITNSIIFNANYVGSDICLFTYTVCNTSKILYYTLYMNLSNDSAHSLVSWEVSASSTTNTTSSTVPNALAGTWELYV